MFVDVLQENCLFRMKDTRVLWIIPILRFGEGKDFDADKTHHAKFFCFRNCGYAFDCFGKD